MSLVQVFSESVPSVNPMRMKHETGLYASLIVARIGCHTCHNVLLGKQPQWRCQRDYLYRTAPSRVLQKCMAATIRLCT